MHKLDTKIQNQCGIQPEVTKFSMVEHLHVADGL